MRSCCFGFAGKEEMIVSCLSIKLLYHTVPVIFTDLFDSVILNLMLKELFILFRLVWAVQ